MRKDAVALPVLVLALSEQIIPVTAYTADVSPIISDSKTAGALQERVNAPGLYPLQASASSVTVKWYDTSDNELGFKVLERDAAGVWQTVFQTATRHSAASGDDYSFLDTSTLQSGQCYMVAAYNAAAVGYSAEQCTVRPDPNRFPQAVAKAAPQWSGLSNTNDGTGPLQNINLGSGSFLLHAHQTWGVDLDWGDSSLWKVEAQGGPHLMKGQAIALKVWGGGWLKHGTQTFGVDLQLSDSPVYEWYAIGQNGDPAESTGAGNDLTDAGTFALWNSTAKAYLVHGYETWGVRLEWYKVGGNSPAPVQPTTGGVKTEQVFNCAIDQNAVEVFIADQTAGGAFVDKGRVNEQYGDSGCPDSGSAPNTFTPQSGHRYLLVATDNSLPGCDGSDDPQQGPCIAMSVTFVGDTKGVVRIDTVGGNSRIVP